MPGYNKNSEARAYRCLAFCLLSQVLLIATRELKAAELSHSGRLTNTMGQPLEGPVELRIRFYGDETGGSPIGPSLEFSSIPLKDGVYQVNFDLSAAQISEIFGTGNITPVYVEVEADGVIFSRQRYMPTFFALRIPVDNTTLMFNSEGKLTVDTISQSQVSGLTAKLDSLSNPELARSNLGLGALSTASQVSGGTGGTIADGSITNADISATAAIAQGKIVGLTTDLASKEPLIAAGTAGQYYRGDKTWQTLNTDAVVEGTNQYFTQSRARSSVSVSGSPLTYNSSTGVLGLGQASTTAPGFLASSDFVFFNNKQPAITSSSVVNSGTLTSALQNGLELKPFSTGVGQTGEMRFDELLANGTHYVGFKAPDTIASSRIWTLPSSDGGVGQVLSTDGNGVLSWVSGSTGSVTSVGLTASSAGLSISGGPVTTSGSISVGLADDLAAIEGLSSTGVAERTASNTWSTFPVTSAGKALIDDADAGAQRTTLGLGALATLGQVSGGTGGTIADGSITDADISATAAIAQGKIVGLTTDLASKEPLIAAGTAGQYYRGDKTWQTLNTDTVVEGTSQYFTPSRARSSLSVSGSPLTYNSTTGVLGLGQASTTAPGFLASSDFVFFNNKQPAITSSSVVNSGTLTSALQNGMELKPFSTGVGQTGEMRFDELSANGTHYVGFKAPDAIASSRIWTLPSSDGGSGQVLSTDGSGVLSWISRGVGSVTSVGLSASTAGLSISGGPVTTSGSISVGLADDLAAIEGLSSTGVAERTAANTWSTFPVTSAGKALIDDADAGAQRTTLGLGALATLGQVSGGTGGTIADGSITDADISATAAITQGKIAGLTTDLASKEPLIAAGTAGQYYRGDKTWQTLNTDTVVEGTSQYFTPSRARSSLSVSGSPLTYNSSTGVLGLGQASTTAPGFLASSDFVFFNNKQPAITSSSVVNGGTLTSALQNGMELKPFSTGVGQTGEMRFDELSANGTHYVGFKAPDAIASSRIWTLPSSDGGSGQVLSTDGNGVLSWVSGSTGSVTSVGLSASTAGLSISGGPVTTSGSISVGLADDLAAIEGLSSTGVAERTAANTWSTFPVTSAGKALIDDADAGAQRTTLGLGALATLGQVSGGTGGTIADGSITDADISATAVVALGSKAANEATSSNTPSKIVARDTSGNFAAGTITATLNGNATNVTGVVQLANGGTGASTKAAAFNALSPLTTLGDTLYVGSDGSNTRLAGNTSTSRMFLSSTGTGTSSAAPGWNILSSSDIPSLDASKVTTGTFANALVNWAAPSAIGSGTPSSGQFTTLTSTGATSLAASGGNVGIGMGSTSAKLQVNGQAASVVANISSLNVDFNSGNIQTNSIGAGTLSFANMIDGGSYTLVLTNATGGNYVLSATGITSWRCSPGCPSNTVTVTAGKHTIVSLFKVGAIGYVSWIRDL